MYAAGLTLVGCEGSQDKVDPKDRKPRMAHPKAFCRAKKGLGGGDDVATAADGPGLMPGGQADRHGRGEGVFT